MSDAHRNHVIALVARVLSAQSALYAAQNELDRALTSGAASSPAPERVDVRPTSTRHTRSYARKSNAS